MIEIVFAVIFGILALASLIISIMSFMEKGFVFNNAYIWATKRERAEMDKKPYYRQSANAFAFVSVIFLCMAIEIILATGWLWIVVGLFCIAVLCCTKASL